MTPPGPCCRQAARALARVSLPVVRMIT